MFEKATRMKLRFDFKGQCSVEDLWDLSLQNLDTIYKKLNNELKQQSESSLLNQKTKAHETLELKINIVTYIVNVKLEEKRKKDEEAKNKEKKEKILKIIEEKQDESLKNMDIEELNRLAKQL